MKEAHRSGGWSDGSPQLTEEFRRFADRSHDVVYRYDVVERRYQFWNEVGLLTYGSDAGAQHPTRHSVMESLLPEDRERVRSVVKESRRSGARKGEVEYRIRHGDGSVRWMHDRWIVICDAEGRPTAIEGVVRDNTERKQAEEALRASRERYRRLVETMNDGLIVMDAAQVLTYANQRFCSMLGYADTSLVGSPVSRLLVAGDVSVLRAQAARRGSGARTPYEIRWLGEGGGVIPTIVSPEPVFDTTGEQEGSFAVVTDISEQKRIQHALEERERELEAKQSSLEDMIGALHVLLRRREEDKAELQRSLARSVRESIEPYLEKLKATPLGAEQEMLLSILEASFHELIVPCFGPEHDKYDPLTAAESQVAKLVRIGKSTKEIAAVLNLSPRTVESHRYNIRKKLGMRHSGNQLRTRLGAANRAATPRVHRLLQELGTR
ncbi:MAG: PAS domain S-box protein [Proteobacteria bacterium]|nr:PAS domain S-box protein [Pseudomonadota bacterium]